MSQLWISPQVKERKVKGMARNGLGARVNRERDSHPAIILISFFLLRASGARVHGGESAQGDKHGAQGLRSRHGGAERQGEVARPQAAVQLWA